MISEVDKQTIMQNYLQIKKEVKGIVDGEIERMLNTSELTGLIAQKGE
jgi:hypothetical protein